MFEPLQLGNAGRVVGDDAVDVAAAQRRPEVLTVVGFPDGRAALELRRPRRDRLGLEHEVVRARLDRDGDPVATGRAHHRHRVRTGQMQQVHGRTGVPGRLDELRDREVLDAARAGGEEVGVLATARRRRLRQRVAVLGVHDHHGAEPCELGQIALQLHNGQRRELVHPGRRQEALEPEDALVVQAAQVVDVAGDGAAPEADVDVAAPVRGLPLDLQRVDRAGGRQAVERHVQDRRDAARRGGPGGRREPLPFGAAGLVDVHVGVDEAGQQHLVVGEVDGRADVAGDGVVGLDRGDDAVAHPDGGRCLARGRHDPPGADHEVHQRPALYARQPPYSETSLRPSPAACTSARSMTTSALPPSASSTTESSSSGGSAGMNRSRMTSRGTS